MRLLDRYQLREFLTAFAYCLAGILVFWVSFELLGEMEELRERSLGFVETATYLMHRLPLHLLMQIPVALLLALLYAVTRHARYHELIAMRAAGVSLWRISLPYLGVAIVLSLAMLALNEFVIPDAATRAEAVLERRSGARAAQPGGAPSPGSEWRQKLNFRDQRTGRVWSVAAFHPPTGEVRGVHVQWPGEEGRREEMFAQRGTWEDGTWTFENVTRFTFGDRGAEEHRSETNVFSTTLFPETPAHLRSEVKISRMLGSLKKSRQVQLSLREIRTYRELHHGLEPHFDLLLRTWFHDRLASPWTCVVVVLIGLPAAAGSGRRNVFVGVAAAIFLAFAFFVLKEFSLAAGSGGYLPPWLAAWLPNLAFGSAGLLALSRLR